MRIETINSHNLHQRSADGVRHADRKAREQVKKESRRLKLAGNPKIARAAKSKTAEGE